MFERTKNETCRLQEVKMMNAQNQGASPVISESDAQLVAQIREITARGNNVEIRRKGEGFSIMEVKKRHIKIEE